MNISRASFEADPVIYLEAMGYSTPRLLPSGEWAALQKMLTTTGLIVGLHHFGYRTRFCYDGPGQERNAAEALAVWDGAGWPPGYWLKQKPEDISNPAR